MKCPVCGFEENFNEKFDELQYVSDLLYNTEPTGGYDDYGNGSGVDVITDIVVNYEYLKVCPVCGIVKFNKDN